MTEFTVATTAFAPGPVRVVLQFAAPPEAPALAHANACLEKFCRLGRCGGLRPTVDSSFTAFAVSAPCAPVVGSDAEALIDIDTMPPGAWHLLRNMLEEPEDETLHPMRVTVAPAAQSLIGGAPLVRLDDENEDEQYPGETAGRPWPLETVDRSFSKSRRALVEFTQEVSNDWFYALRDGLRVWADVLEAGGFAAPKGEPWEVDSILGAIQVFDAWTVEVEVSCFDASEAAWPLMANVIDCYAGHVMPVLKVSIE